jgi:hypothetical protein
VTALLATGSLVFGLIVYLALLQSRAEEAGRSGTTIIAEKPADSSRVGETPSVRERPTQLRPVTIALEKQVAEMESEDSAEDSLPQPPKGPVVRKVRTLELAPPPGPALRKARMREAQTEPLEIPPATNSFVLANIKLKRRSKATEEDLCKQLLGVPEVGLASGKNTAAQVLKEAKRTTPKSKPKGSSLQDVVLEVIRQRPDLAGLPVRQGKACRLSKDTAKDLETLGAALRQFVDREKAKGNKGGMDPSRYYQFYYHSKINEKLDSAAAIPALQQILMTEDRLMRLLLVQALDKIAGKVSSLALAQRALFDLDAEVREAAILCLNQRPREQYEDVLLEGLRYPWAPVADHAAEALVALNIQEAVPKMVGLLDAADPLVPFKTKVANKEVWMVRELVQVNHLSNCFLCHQESSSRKDPVRGFVPTPGQRIVAYYASRSGSFIRADVTYLKQDFSMHRTVAKPGNWPKVQRYDYLVRVRQLTKEEQAKHPLRDYAGKSQASGSNRDAVLFALRELTGKDAGLSAKQWQKVVAKGDFKNRTKR